jgi:hypothetical protein
MFFFVFMGVGIVEKRRRQLAGRVTEDEGIRPMLAEGRAEGATPDPAFILPDETDRPK